MKVTPLNLAGLLLVETRSFTDDRGFFMERWSNDVVESLELPASFVQDNFSRSNANVVRGLHYQFDRPQAKLLTCLSGRILDVTVDLRKRSSTFGHHCSVELSGDKPAWLWIPPGFAHGFSVLSQTGADVWYKVDQPYNPAGEGGICWSDRKLGIEWGVSEAILSNRDRSLPNFEEYLREPRF